MGSGGAITLRFGELLRSIWKGKEDKIYPANFVKTLSEKAPHVMIQSFMLIVGVRITVGCLRILGLFARLVT